MPKKKLTPATQDQKWKCPGCGLWVKEPMGNVCQKCKDERDRAQSNS